MDIIFWYWTLIAEYIECATKYFIQRVFYNLTKFYASLPGTEHIRFPDSLKTYHLLFMIDCHANWDEHCTSFESIRTPNKIPMIMNKPKKCEKNNRYCGLIAVNRDHVREWNYIFVFNIEFVFCNIISFIHSYLLVLLLWSLLLKVAPQKILHFPMH